MKCPMMMNTQLIRSFVYADGTKDNNLEISTVTDCIGAECAAYVEREFFVSKTGTWHTVRYEEGMGKIKKWSCAMMPREVWRDVEDKDAKSK